MRLENRLEGVPLSATHRRRAIQGSPASARPGPKTLAKDGPQLQTRACDGSAAPVESPRVSSDPRIPIASSRYQIPGRRWDTLHRSRIRRLYIESASPCTSVPLKPGELYKDSMAGALCRRWLLGCNQYNFLPGIAPFPMQTARCDPETATGVPCAASVAMLVE